ncbi:MAG: hydrogenase maturation nickel metallochaperone HypA [Acidobacteriota bacterium]|nr:hydrogenase maturation nickel metallochaperone HypA [Acidobacteriota bacterium]MDH3529338.1 hydrogenase maturation nickel metallochaperone HypA [Acidobacteriota bacterium]
MHELSIALSMVDIATETAERNGGGKVTAIYLKLGALAGVVKDALQFSWEAACADTVLEGSRLVIEDVPVVVCCSGCRAERKLDSINRLICPVCQQPTPAVVQGKELEVTGLEIE